jgi:hypothetical protein
MSADLLQPTLIAMFQAREAVPAAHVAPRHAEETADDQVPDEKGGREQDAVVEIERSSQEMVDPRKPRKSLMPKWRIIGVGRKLAQKLQLELKPLQHKMISI